MKIMGVERTVDLAKEKKMGVKRMVEVKNAQNIMGIERTVDLSEEKKMAVKRMVEVKNAYENNGY